MLGQDTQNKISYENIKKYNEKKALWLAEVMVSDSWLIVMFQKTFDNETGQPNPLENFYTTTKEDLIDEIESYQEKIDAINTFITNEI